VKEPVLRPTIPSSEMQVGRLARLRILGDKGAGFAIAKRTTIAEAAKTKKDRPSYVVPRSVPDEEEQEEQVEGERPTKATCSTRFLEEKGPGFPIADTTQQLRHAPATVPTPTATWSEGAGEEVQHDTITRLENVVQHPKQPLPKMEEKHRKTGIARSEREGDTELRKGQTLVKDPMSHHIPFQRVGQPVRVSIPGEECLGFPIAGPTQKTRHAPTTEPTPTAASSACGGEDARFTEISPRFQMVNFSRFSQDLSRCRRVKLYPRGMSA
jgi:hypothetical protein